MHISHIFLFLTPLKIFPPDEVKRLFFVEAKKASPVLIQVKSLTLTLWILCPLPVAALNSKQKQWTFSNAQLKSVQRNETIKKSHKKCWSYIMQRVGRCVGAIVQESLNSSLFSIYSILLVVWTSCKNIIDLKALKEIYIFVCLFVFY